MLHIPFRVIPPDVDEHVLPGEEPGHYVTRLSRAKAEAVVGRAPGEIILAADTTVVLDGAIFEKPTSPANAVEMLTRLQGRTHEVMTAVAVARDKDIAQALDVPSRRPRHTRSVRRDGRADGQGRRVRDPGTRRAADRSRGRRLLRSDGTAA